MQPSDCVAATAAVVEAAGDGVASLAEDKPVAGACATVSIAAVDSATTEVVRAPAIMGAEVITSRHVLLCNEVADAFVPVDVSPVRLAADDAGGGQPPAESGNTDNSSNAEGTIEAGNYDKTKAADASPDALAAETAAWPGTYAMPISKCASGESVLTTTHTPALQQEVRPQKPAKRIMAPKSLSSSLLGQITSKAPESVGNGAAVHSKDLIVETVIDPTVYGGDVVHVPLNYIEDVGSMDSSVPQDFDDKYAHLISDGIEVLQSTQCDNKTKRRRRHNLKNRTYNCPECDYRAFSNSNLKRHMFRHTNERQFSCDRCPLKFRQKIHLDKHVKYIHEVKSVKCSLCDFICANETPDLKMHMKRIHLTVDLTSGQRAVIECDRCSFLASSKRDMKQHYKIHKRGPELKLYCEQCSFVTDCESRLTRHMLTHSKVKPFGCSLCEYKSTQQAHIKRHMKRRHQVHFPGPARSRKRQGSSLAFREPSEVSSDGQFGIVMSQKNDPPDFRETLKVLCCHYCTMKFCKAINLYKHLHAQHASLMPPLDKDGLLSCVLCDYKSRSKRALLVHLRKHNEIAHRAAANGAAEDVPDKVYECTQCEYKTPTRKYLSKHRRSKHMMSLKLSHDGSANCIIEPNAVAAAAVPTIEHRQETDIISLMDDKGSGNGLIGDEAQMEQVVNIEELANSIKRPILVPGNAAGIADTVAFSDIKERAVATDSGGDNENMNEDDEGNGTAETEPLGFGAHGVVTAQTFDGWTNGLVGSKVAPTAKYVARNQAGEAITRLAADAGGSSNASSSACATYPSTTMLNAAHSLSDFEQYVQLPAGFSGQLSSGDFMEINVKKEPQSID